MAETSAGGVECPCVQSTGSVFKLHKWWQQNDGLSVASQLSRANLWVCAQPSQSDVKRSEAVRYNLHTTYYSYSSKKYKTVGKKPRRVNTAGRCGHPEIYRTGKVQCKKPRAGRYQPSDCIWRRINVTTAVQEAIHDNQSQKVVFFNKLTAISDSCKRKCLGFADGHRRQTFLELRYHPWFSPFKYVTKDSQSPKPDSTLLDSGIEPNIPDCGLHNVSIHLLNGFQVKGSRYPSIPADIPKDKNIVDYQYCSGKCEDQDPSLALLFNGDDRADTCCRPIQGEPIEITVTTIAEAGEHRSDLVRINLRQNTAQDCQCANSTTCTDI